MDTSVAPCCHITPNVDGIIGHTQVRVDPVPTYTGRTQCVLLHWLPVHYRIITKNCTIAYQALSSTQPAYLNSMLTPPRNSGQLRSTTSNPLYIPRVKTKAGTRAFSVAAPTVWNSLPASVKSEGNIVSFRRRLKIDLFNAAYPP